MAAPMVTNVESTLITNVHLRLANDYAESVTVCGEYKYFHYCCDGMDDRGWGCGYRTLQSLCSWVKHEQSSTNLKPRDIPSLPNIQEALVAMEDKPLRFQGSKDWIGSFEVCLCLDYFYDVPCKIIHVKSGKELPNHLHEIKQHLLEFGSPIMMGGESDASSKGVVGVCENPQALLIVDPHFYGAASTPEYLQETGWVKWRLIDEFRDHTFYNLCLPRLKGRDLT